MVTLAAPILLTGFEPFAGEPVNPSGEVARVLDARVIAGAHVVGVVLPCVFGASLAALRAALARHRPQLVLALGQAAGRPGFSLERVAINVDDARIADNAGARPIDRPVVAGAVAAHFSTLPIKTITAALREAGWPAEVSQTAGTFVCNHVFYGLMHALRRRRPTCRAGFMHLPLLPEQVARFAPGVACLPLAQQVAGVARTLEVAMTTVTDLADCEGALG